jgi:hypothetical protein
MKISHKPVNSQDGAALGSRAPDLRITRDHLHYDQSLHQQLQASEFDGQWLQMQLEATVGSTTGSTPEILEHTRSGYRQALSSW